MTKEEIEKKIKDIEEANFQLQMKDHWSDRDFEISHNHHVRLRELEEQLKNME